MIKLKPSKFDVNSKMSWSLILKNYAGVLTRNPPKWILLNVKSNKISKRSLTQFLIWEIGRNEEWYKVENQFYAYTLYLSLSY